MAVTLPDYSDKTRWDDAAGAAMRRVREADPDAADLPVFQGAQAHVCGEQTGKRALAFHFVER